jgi:hypothetical protein
MTLPGSAADAPKKETISTEYKVNIMVCGEMIGFTVEEALRLASQLIIGAEVAVAGKI